MIATAVPTASGDDIRDQLVFDLHDLILQHQLLLFQPPQRQRIGAPGKFKRMHSLIQIAMLTAQHL